MSILDTTINDTNLVEKYHEYVNYDPELKDKYGEVNTPYQVINEMLSMIPEEKLKNKDYKWLDAGAGRGNFSCCLFFILFKSLYDIILDPIERKEHIIKNMIYIVEINENNILHLREKFGENANIYNEDYLEWNTDLQFDFIIGNPPYNSGGVKKVPTNSAIDKKEDGKTIWPQFIKKNLALLKDGGMMSVIIPSIWMKPDKARIYELLLKYKIDKLHALDSSTVMKVFNYQVQTPLCHFLLIKSENEGKIELYDKQKKDYIDFTLKENIPIPLCFASIVNKFLVLREKYGKLKIIKTNMPKKGTVLKEIFSLTHPFQNVHTTTINKATKQPELQFKYSDDEQPFCGEPKIIMAHKMYGFPYIDKEGIYGISSRDNYIIRKKSIEKMELIKEFLSTTLILFLFETTRYRMRYLEKYVFEYIPDFSKIPEAIEMYNSGNVDVYKLFGLTEEEKEYVERYYKIKYKFFE
jgi:hypothetical protein